VSSDTEPPVIDAQVPPSTSESVITVTGTAADNVGITEVSWSNDRGGSGVASGTETWTIPSIPLASGVNTIQVVARDAAGNTAGIELTVEYTPSSTDTEPPVIDAQAPAATAEPVITITGTAADNVGVTEVSWSNDRGGSGVASGTETWTIPSIPLASGVNTIHVAARDAAGNTSGIDLTVEYTPSGSTVTVEYGSASGSDLPGTVEDTHMNAGQPGMNYAGDARFIIYTWPAGACANSVLIKWDLSALPPDAVILDARVHLYVEGFLDSGGDENYAVSVHQVIHHDPKVSACTWSTYDGAASWTGGATGGLADAGAAQDLQWLDKSTGYQTWNVTDMVRDWAADPASNYGMLFLSDQDGHLASSDTNRTFTATDSPNAAQRPKLIIQYTVSGSNLPPPPPTPRGLRLMF
jgi:hypothetical protein